MCFTSNTMLSLHTKKLLKRLQRNSHAWVACIGAIHCSTSDGILDKLPCKRGMRCYRACPMEVGCCLLRLFSGYGISCNIESVRLLSRMLGQRGKPILALIIRYVVMVL